MRLFELLFFIDGYSKLEIGMPREKVLDLLGKTDGLNISASVW